MNSRRKEMWTASRWQHYNDFRIFIMGVKGNDEIFGPGITYEGVWNEPKAMTERRQVILKSYHSASSGTISHRLVEPVAFTDHYQSISAYEPASGCNKYFNIERIEEVELLDTLHAHEGEHEFRRPDAFGYQITTPAREVFMIMEMAPMLYVRRLYPMARPQIRETKRPGFYELKLEVGNYTAPAGIVRLFPNQVKVYGDNGFLRFLKK